MTPGEESVVHSPTSIISWQDIAWRLVLTALLLLTLAASSIFIFNPSSQTEPHRLPLSQQVNRLAAE